MKILITGGAGYIGSHLAHEAIALGHDVIIVDDLSQGVKKNLPPKALFVESDIVSEKALAQVSKFGVEAVFHFAAHTSVPESMKAPLKYYENNTAKSSKLIRFCKESKIRYFIFSSTAAVYGNSKDALVSENSPTEPISPYGRSKLMTEQILKDVSSSDIKYSILRYFNVAGASLKHNVGQSTPEATHVIKVAAEVAAGKRKLFELYGSDYQTSDGSSVRDYIHVDDLVDAHIQALHYLQKGGASEIFNCGYQRGYSVKEVVESMKKVSGKNFEVVVKPRRLGDIQEIIADNKKIKATLNFRPKCDDLDVICRSAYEWELKLK